MYDKRFSENDNDQKLEQDFNHINYSWRDIGSNHFPGKHPKEKRNRFQFANNYNSVNSHNTGNSNASDKGTD